MRIAQILTIALGVIFVLGGGCTVLFWGVAAAAYTFDSFSATVVAIGAIVMALGIWMIVRAARQPPAGHRSP